jgi:hypothetical protein
MRAPPVAAPARRVVALMALGVLAAGVSASRTAHATPPDRALLDRLSHTEQDIELAGKRLSFRAERVVEQLDGDGKVSSTRTTRYRVESDGKTTHEIVEAATEDGKDVTADEQDKARTREAKRASKKADPADAPVWPFAPSSQARYTYDQVAVDPANPANVEISFVPKNPDSHTFEGKAWIDTANARILSASVRLSKPPTLVDWVHFNVEFASTPAGPTLSHLKFEASGGLLFIRKHFRGEIKMSDWRVAP